MFQALGIVFPSEMYVDIIIAIYIYIYTLFVCVMLTYPKYLYSSFISGKLMQYAAPVA